jgi:hypothetical protein
MPRAPILAAFVVLAALAFLSTAARPVRAAAVAGGFAAERVSSRECPWLDPEGRTALPEGHPPIGRDLLPPGHPPVDDDLALPPGHPPVDGHRASRLPPGHPSLGGTPVFVPRFDRQETVDL